jgi:hypothetical protein
LEAGVSISLDVKTAKFIAEPVNCRRKHRSMEADPAAGMCDELHRE